jgi:hypothetical protein
MISAAFLVSPVDLVEFLEETPKETISLRFTKTYIATLLSGPVDSRIVIRGKTGRSSGCCAGCTRHHRPNIEWTERIAK